jgi:energy-coupling factor transporter ATP-binding protein EcfA2
MLIMGPSGSGKSSLLRIIAGLWPVDDGIVYRPLKIGRDGLFFVPQRPYITQGSLRTQILYPDTVEMQSCNDDTLKVKCDERVCRCCLIVIGLLWSRCCCDCVCAMVGSAVKCGPGVLVAARWRSGLH